VIAELTGFLGCALKGDPRFYAKEVGVNSENQRPGTEGDFRPWRVPLAVTPAAVIPSDRLTLYRMGRDSPTPPNFWLSWTTEVHVIRAFDALDPFERTYFTGAIGGPQWAANNISLASTPYPGTTRLLAVPQPTVAPTVTLVTDGPSGESRRLYYCYTWVNDIGWESAPSPPTLAPLAKPGAVLNLSTTESPPAGNYGINRIRWYRTQTTSTQGEAEFFFLREYAVGSSGNQDDARDLGADVLPTEFATLRLPLPADAKWLTYCWNEFAASIVGKTVRFCEPGLVYAWPLGNEYTLDNTPIALCSFAQRLLVLTSGGAELFTGDAPERLDQKPIALAPCVSSRSVVTADYWCAWAAADGLWLYSADGSTRNLTANIMDRNQWQALSPATMHCHRLDLGENMTLIVGFYNDGASKGFVLNPANDRGIYFLSQGYSAAYWDKLLRRLFVLAGADDLREWDAGASFMTAKFRSKVYRQQAHTEAQWLELLATGDVTARVFTSKTDAPSSFQTDMNAAVQTGVTRLPDGTGGRDFQVELETQAQVQGAVIE
jgi:hypothetical protein